MEIMSVEQGNTLLIDSGFFGKSLSLGAMPATRRHILNAIFTESVVVDDRILIDRIFVLLTNGKAVHIL